jgi:hypothetical protein
LLKYLVGKNWEAGVLPLNYSRSKSVEGEITIPRKKLATGRTFVAPRHYIKQARSGQGCGAEDLENQSPHTFANILGIRIANGPLRPP